MPPSVHVAQPGRFALAVVDVPLLDEGLVCRNQCSFDRQTVCCQELVALPPQYSGRTVARLLTPTDSTASLVQAALQGLHQIYREGFKYSKAGVCLLDLATQQQADAQRTLFSSGAVVDTSDRSTLMAVLDGIKQRYGRSTIAAASSFAPDDAVWKMRQERMTPAYTKDWGQIIDVWK